jgi:hypothetical protein
MKTVFMQAIAAHKRPGKALRFFTRELQELPGSLLDAYMANWLRGGNPSMRDKYISPATRWQAILGILPFLAFGISSMIGKIDHIYLPLRHNAEMIVYCLVLLGLLIGWTRGFPLWSYSNLGWSLVLAWSNTNITIYGVRWGYQVWIPFGITVLIALLWTRSLTPLQKLFRDCWNDWTRLSLMMYTLGAWAWIFYDENHHPLLLVFIFASALVATGAVWVFLRSSRGMGRILSISFGFIFGKILSDISYATWDYRSYYGLPESTRTWYQSLGITIAIMTFWFGILFWPALIGLIQRIAYRRIA